MAHWAEIDENFTVLRVVVTDNDDPNNDEGHQWLIDNLGGTWVKTSYNAIAGKRRDPETHEITDEPGFRKNYAGVGYVYDEERDAFISPKPDDFIDAEGNSRTFTLNEDTCTWEATAP